jgi:ABC-type polysaccharide/polyol phosphate transport system ATPase subunit
VGTVAVDVQHISKRFRLFEEKYTTLKERVIHIGRVPYHELKALDDVSFDVKEGETFGILGRNGSGKSTLLKCIMGVLQPTSGQVVVRGKLAGLLELGAGFQQELSGRDNIYLNGSMLGMTKREVDSVFDEIVDFSELGDRIETPVKFFSSGMYVRLGFAIAVNVDPDVLVVDEVLAVGDEKFQRKCLERIKMFQEQGRTILFVSHAPDMVKTICDRAVVLHDGKMVGLGFPGEAVRTYREYLLAADDVLGHTAFDGEPPTGSTPAVSGARPAATRPPGRGEKAPSKKNGKGEPAGGTAERDLIMARAFDEPDTNRPVRISGAMIGYPDSDVRRYTITGEPLNVRVWYQASEPVTGAEFVIEIQNENGEVIFRTDSDILGCRFDLVEGPGAFEFQFASFPLLDGAYDVNLGVQSRLGGVMFDWKEAACRFEVMFPGRSTGFVDLPVQLVEVDLVAEGQETT